LGCAKVTSIEARSILKAGISALLPFSALAHSTLPHPIPFSSETEQIKAKVERLSGLPVHIEEDPTLKVLVNVTLAQST
jgi:hypothetical protein